MKTQEELLNEYRKTRYELDNQLFKDLKDNNVSYYNQLDALDYVFDAWGDTNGIHHTNPELDQLIFDLWYDCDYERRSTITFQWQIENLKDDWISNYDECYYKDGIIHDKIMLNQVLVLLKQYKIYYNKDLEWSTNTELINNLIETLSRYVVEYGIQHRISGFHWDW